MEHKKICVVVGLCVFMQAVGLVSTVSLRRLNERIDLLENTLGNRIEFENTQRHKDFESLMAKLSEISTRIGNWEEKLSSLNVNAESTLDNVGVSENIDSQQSDILKYFINGIKEEKAANAILRRELHDALNEMDSRMKREVSRLDASITKADKIFDERNEQVILAIDNVKDTVLAKISDTSEILSEVILSINNVNDTMLAKISDTSEIIHEVKLSINNVNDTMLAKISDTSEILREVKVSINNVNDTMLAKISDTSEILREVKVSFNNVNDTMLAKIIDTSEILHEVKVSINNVNDTMLAKISDTSKILRDRIDKRKDSLIADQTDTQQTIQNDIENTIKKQCNLDKTNDITEKAIERLWTNMSASFDETRMMLGVFESCHEALSYGHRKSGVYKVEGMKVYCDQTTDGGGWTVFQRRMNGEVDFFRNWQDYKIGFGDIEKEFWLGNEKISKLLRQGNHQLRIDMEDFDGDRAYAKYNSFHVGPESTDYTLTVTGFSGDANDALDYHNGMKFSTKDRDLDNYYRDCAAIRKGGWWYKQCAYSNLNGLYLTPPEANKNNDTGIFWYHWKKNWHSLKFVEMKFR